MGCRWLVATVVDGGAIVQPDGSHDGERDDARDESRSESHNVTFTPCRESIARRVAGSATGDPAADRSLGERLAFDDLGEREVLAGLGNLGRDAVADVRLGHEDDVSGADSSDAVALVADVLDLHLTDFALGDRWPAVVTVLGLGPDGGTAIDTLWVGVFARFLRPGRQHGDPVPVTDREVADLEFAVRDGDRGVSVPDLDFGRVQREQVVWEFHGGRSYFLLRPGPVERIGCERGVTRRIHSELGRGADVHIDEPPRRPLGVAVRGAAFERPAPARLELEPNSAFGVGPSQRHLVAEPGVVGALGDAESVAVDSPAAGRSGLPGEARPDGLDSDQSLRDADLDGRVVALVAAAREERPQWLSGAQRVVVGFHGLPGVHTRRVGPVGLTTCRRPGRGRPGNDTHLRLPAEAAGMEAKRELTSVDVAALARELGDYEGAFFDKAYLYDDDLVRFKLRHHEHGRAELLVNVRDPKHVRVATPDHVPSAPERPPDFAMMLRNRLEGSTFAGVEQFEFDRILELRFERDGDSTTVVVELFGDGNFAVLDATGGVVDCLETVRLKSRTVAPGAQYEFPEARFNPLAVDEDGFAARMRDSDTDVVRTLATRLNFGGLWAEELCTRADVPKTLDIGEVTDDQIAAVYREVQALVETLDDGAFDPHVYYEATADADDVEADRRPVDVTPVAMEEYAGLDADRFDTFNGAIDHYVERLAAVESAAPESSDGDERQRPDFEAEIEKQQRIIEQQEGAIEDFTAQAEAEREKAELLYANYDLADEILSTVQDARENDVPWAEIEATFADGAERGIDAAEAVVDVDGSEGTVTIDLGDHDVTVVADTGVEKNADRLYTEAKRIEEKRAGAETAVEETRDQLAEVKERRDAWDAGEDEDEDDLADEADEPDEIDWLSRQSIPVRQDEQWYEEFRWFHTSDDFLVIGGRNADQNEALVAKYLDRGDRFVHAQAHGGPATILKATGPSEPTREVDVPQSSLEEAAQFAVSYSSVWKDGKFAGDVYAVDHDQVSKTPESGEYLEKGGFAIRGDRTYFEDTPVGVAVGITCEPETRVIGGPPSAIEGRAETTVRLEPGKYAQNDAAKRVYRELRGRFADESFVRKVASPDLIQEFLPPGGSRMVDD